MAFLKVWTDFVPKAAVLAGLAALICAAPAHAGTPAEKAAAAMSALKAVARSGDEDAKFRVYADFAACAPEAAVPLLVEAHKDKDPDVREIARWVMSAFEPLPESAGGALVGAFGGDDKVFADAAEDTLSYLKVTYPLLVKALGSPSPKIRGRVLKVLGRKKDLEEKDLPLVTRMMREDPDRKVRENAVWALGEVRPVAAAVPGELLSLYPGADYGVCSRAAEALAKFDSADLHEVNLKMLGGANGGVRRCAALYFNYAGKPPKEAVPLLAGLLRDKEPAVRGAAAVTLANLAPRSAGVAGELARQLSDPDPRTRGAAALALSRPGLQAGQAVDALKKLLKDKEDEPRIFAAGALASIAPGTEGLLPVLAGALADQPADLRIYASGAIIRLGTGAVSAIPALARSLKDDEMQVRDNALIALGNLGPAARSAVPAMVMSREHYYGDIYGGKFGKILAGIGPAPEALPEIITIAGSKRHGAPGAAIEAIALLGPAAAAAVPVLIKKLGDGVNRRAAAAALEKIGGAAIAPLWAVLKKGEYPSSAHAAEMLAGMGQAGQEKLAGALEDKDDFVVMCALRAFSRSGPGAASMLPRVEKLARHPSEYVRLRAKKTAEIIRKARAGRSAGGSGN